MATTAQKDMQIISVADPTTPDPFQRQRNLNYALPDAYNDVTGDTWIKKGITFPQTIVYNRWNFVSPFSQEKQHE